MKMKYFTLFLNDEYLYEFRKTDMAEAIAHCAYGCAKLAGLVVSADGGSASLTDGDEVFDLILD
jgi:hypothetical protein